ncbi:MAG: hypothetical protein JNM33_00485 [Rubrivivax sp.]|nr:hypothetical protein [Rubrivivax sp.]
MEARRFTPPPVRAVFQALFRRDVELHLEGGHPRLVLADVPEPARPAQPSQAPAQVNAEQALMHRQLAALLDEQPGARQVLRHLALFEVALEHHGLEVLQRAPLPLLHAALDQFEGLVSNWSPVGLATLRSKMAVALVQRDQEDGSAGRPATPDFCASTLPLRLEHEARMPGVEVRCDDAEVAEVYRAMGLADAAS